MEKDIPIFVSFFTPEYEHDSELLVKTLIDFNLAFNVDPIKSLGTWERNCGQKAEYILSMLDKYPGHPIVWIDSDARVKSKPVLFYDLTSDFAAHWKGEAELLSGTLYFGNTEYARTILTRWRSRNDEHPTVWDQKNLQWVIENSRLPMRVSKLPSSYCLIFDSMQCDGGPVIEHFQASRRLKHKVK